MLHAHGRQNVGYNTPPHKQNIALSARDCPSCLCTAACCDAGPRVSRWLSRSRGRTNRCHVNKREANAGPMIIASATVATVAAAAVGAAAFLILRGVVRRRVVYDGATG